MPQLAEFVGRRELKLFDLMVVALLEHGAPLSIERLAVLLSAAGVGSGTGDMVYSLKKSWHGMEPVYRDAEGRLALNLSSRELDRRLFRLGLRGSRTAAPRVDLQPAPAPTIPDDVPLSEDEVRWAFAGQSLSAVSPLRQVAAVLDAVGQPMTVAALDAYLSNLTAHRYPLGEETILGWRSACIDRDPEERLCLDRTASDVPAMRRAIRKLAVKGREQEFRQQQFDRFRKVREAELAQEHAQARQVAARLRRAVLRVVPDSGPVAAAVLLDVGARTIRTFVGGELAELPAMLGTFDLVAALYVRETLQSIGFADADRFRLVDLKPPQKTRRLNRQGRTLAITPELLITSTTGISHPLGDPAKTADYLASGHETKLRRRLESDAKSLFAFYRYGALHGCVRLRWGFLDETLPADWAVPGEESLYAMLHAFHAANQPVEIVWGSAPGWADPWSRARRVTIVALDGWSALVEGDDQQWQVSRYEIQAVRPASERPNLEVAHDEGKQPNSREFGMT